jgi:replicative DNA helicase
MVYEGVQDFLSSQDYQEMKTKLADAESVWVPQEEEFDLDSIDFNERISYPISWGISALDDELWGKPRWKYTMLYGWPSTGKTTLTLQIALENAKLWHKVRYLSLEMPKKDFVMQNMRTRAWIKQKWVWEAVVPSLNQKDIMQRFIRDIKQINIVGYVNQPSLEEFKSILNSLKLKWDDMIIIDNLWMIWRNDPIDELKLYWMISSVIKDFCDETGIDVTILHHTNKWSEGQNWRRGFSAFRGNGKIADDCDYVVQLQREYLDTWETQSCIKVEKDRIGWNNGYTIWLQFDKWVFKKDIFQ